MQDYEGRFEDHYEGKLEDYDLDGGELDCYNKAYNPHSIVHCKSSELGEFDYDNSEFEMRRFYDTREYYLYYIGEETDGSKIKIPDGIKDCSHIFDGCKNLIKPPVIPKSVKNCSYMFENCDSLEIMPKIPDDVKNCEGMFAGCRKLTTVSKMPNSVENCEGMFAGCKNLIKPPMIPNSAKNCSYMFADCRSLRKTPAIPDGVENCSHMFYDCKSLLASPSIPDSVKDCTSMFANCTSLKTVPKIPEGMEKGECMFSGCDSNVSKAGDWNIKHRGQSYYEWQSKYGTVTYNEAKQTDDMMSDKSNALSSEDKSGFTDGRSVVTLFDYDYRRDQPEPPAPDKDPSGDFGE